MEHLVRPQHLYSRDETCTHSSLHRIPPSLVAFHICYLLDCASVNEISTLVIWFHCMLDIFNHYGDLDPLYIFTLYGDLNPLYIFIVNIFIYYILYVAMTTHVTFCISCLFMSIVLLCIRDCYMYLQSYAEIDYCTILMDGWFFHLVLHHFWDGFYNVFQPSCYPFDLTH